MTTKKENWDRYGFGDLLRTKRKEKGLTLRQLGDLLGIHFTYISKLECSRNEYPPSESLTYDIAFTLEIEPEKLVLLTGRIPTSHLTVFQKYNHELPLFLKKLGKNPRFAKTVFELSNTV